MVDFSEFDREYKEDLKGGLQIPSNVENGPDAPTQNPNSMYNINSPGSDTKYSPGRQQQLVSESSATEQDIVLPYRGISGNSMYNIGEVGEDAPDEISTADFANELGIGLNRFAQLAGRGLDVIGLDTVGQAIERKATQREQELAALQSEAFKREKEKTYFGPGEEFEFGPAFTSPTKVAASLLGSLPTMAVAMGTGLGLTRLLIAPFAKLGLSAGVAGIVGSAVGEGGISGAETAKDTYDTIMNAPQAQLETTDEYKNAIVQAGGDPMFAREIVAEGVAKKHGAIMIGLVGVLGAPSGAVLGNIFKESGKGLLETAGKQGIMEAIQETPQSMAEKYTAGLTRQRFVDPTIDPTRGVAEAGAEGFVTGLASGVTLGGGAYAVSPQRGQAEIVRDAQPQGLAQATEQPITEEQLRISRDLIDREPPEIIDHQESLYILETVGVTGNNAEIALRSIPSRQDNGKIVHSKEDVVQIANTISQQEQPQQYISQERARQQQQEIERQFAPEQVAPTRPQPLSDLEQAEFEAQRQREIEERYPARPGQLPPVDIEQQRLEERGIYERTPAAIKRERALSPPVSRLEIPSVQPSEEFKGRVRREPVASKLEIPSVQPDTETFKGRIPIEDIAEIEAPQEPTLITTAQAQTELVSKGMTKQEAKKAVAKMPFTQVGSKRMRNMADFKVEEIAETTAQAAEAPQEIITPQITDDATLDEALEIMRNESAQSETKQTVTDESGKTFNIPATTPQWMLDLNAKMKAQKERLFRREEITTLVNKHLNNKKLTGSQADRFNYLVESANEAIGTIPETIATKDAEYFEGQGFEMIGGKDVPAAEFETGDKFYGDVEGVKDEYEVKSIKDDGTIVVQDGVKREIDIFDTVKVEAIKKKDGKPVQYQATKEPTPDQEENIKLIQQQITPATSKDVKSLLKGAIRKGNVTVNTIGNNVEVTTKNGHTLEIKFVDNIELDQNAFTIGYNRKKKTGEIVTGSYKDNVIQVSKVGDKWTVAHEMFGHFFEDTGILNTADVNILQNRIKKLVKAGKFETANKSDIGGAEDRANFIASELKKRDQAGSLARIIQKIRDFIDQIVNIAYRNSSGVIRGIENGDVIGKKIGETKATEKPTQLDTTTKEFDRWFKGSKVVDENGEPLVVYHGTNKDFTEFDTQFAAQGVFWFSEDRAKIEKGESGAASSKNIIPVYLSAKKLAGWDEYNKLSLGEIENLGFDGIKLDDDYVIFEPNQIKSTENIGTFDPTTPDIRYQTTDSDDIKRTEIKQEPLNNLSKSKFSDFVSKTIPGFKGSKPKLQSSVESSREPGDPFDLSENSTVAETLKYNLINSLDPLKKIQGAIEKTTGKIPEYADALTKEMLRTSKTKAQLDDAERVYFEPIKKIIGESNQTVDSVDEYLYSRHAQEANARLRLTNAKLQLKKLNELRGDNKLSKKINEIDARFDKNPFSVRQEEYFDLLESELKNPKNDKEIAFKKKWDTFKSKPSGITDAEAIKNLEKYKNNRPLQRIAKKFDEFNADRLDIMLESGRLTQQEYDTIKNTFEFYVPLKREGFTDAPSRGTGLQLAGKDIKVRGGSTKRAVNILANAMAQYEASIIKANKAEVSRAFLNLVQDNPNENVWNIEPIKKTPGYDASGNIVENIDMTTKDNEIKLKVDGKVYSISADNEHSYRVIKGLKGDTAQTGPIVNALGKVNRVLAMVNTTMSPEFMITNFLRDIQTATFNLSDTQISDIKKNVIKDVPKAMKGLRDQLRGDGKTEWAKIAKQYEDSGAKIGWIDFAGDMEKRARKLESEIDLFRDGHVAKKSWSKAIKLIEDYNSIVENAVRLSTFKSGVDAGMPIDKAALMAKDLTVNFNQKGVYGPLVNSLYLFSNAGIQGSAKILSVLKNSPKARKMVYQSMAVAVGLSMANRSIGGDDEDGVPYYDKVEDFVKERNIVFMIPNSKGKYVKIPLPWGYNVFWAAGTEVGDMATKDNYSVTGGLSRMMSTITGAFNPVQSSTVMQTLSPTIMDPFVQVAENKTWSGSPLMPENSPFAKIKKPDSELHWPSARKPSVALAKGLNKISGGNQIKPGAIDVSPETLDLLWDTFTGSAGRFAVDTLGLPFGAISGDLELKNIPVARRVVGKKSSYSDSSRYRESIAHVYRLAEEIKTYPEKSKSLKKDRSYRLLSHVKKNESAIRKLKKMLKITTNKKSRDRINKRINDLYVSFNKKFAEINKQKGAK
jgi:hypothetical protein